MAIWKRIERFREVCCACGKHGMKHRQKIKNSSANISNIFRKCLISVNFVWFSAVLKWKSMLCEQSNIITVIIEFKKWFWRQRLRSLSNIVDGSFIAWNYPIWCGCMSGEVWVDWNACWMSWQMLKLDDFQWNKNWLIESWFYCQVIETALKQLVDQI